MITYINSHYVDVIHSGVARIFHFHPTKS